jgi:hypothetical protein
VVARFETAPGKQAQVDFTLGYSRRIVAEAALDQELGSHCVYTKSHSNGSAAYRKRFSTTA